LQLLHNIFLKKRDTPYVVSDLRNMLVAAPYGLPACTLPILTAVAIRHETKRLRWGSTKETNFAKNLVDAFTEDSKLTIRLFEFSKKQLAMLFITGKCLRVEQIEGQSPDEYAAKSASKLREFVNSKPEGVKNSNKLSPSSQSLIKFINTIGQSTQDLADFLIELLDVKAFLPDNDVKAVMVAVQSLFDDFLKVEDAKLLEIKQCWFKYFPNKADVKQSIIFRLRKIGTRQATQLLTMLEQASTASDIETKDVIYRLLNKRFDDCSDSDIGRCVAAIEMLFDQARQSVPDDPVIYPGPPESDLENPSNPQTNGTEGVSTPKPLFDPETMSSEEIAKAQILNLLDSSYLSKIEKIRVLEMILLDYKD